jgi:hypothetical protein
VDLSLLVLVHPRLQDRSAEGSHVQQPLKRSVIRIQSVYARWDMSPDQRGIDQLPPLNANFQLMCIIAYLHFPR